MSYIYNYTTEKDDLYRYSGTMSTWPTYRGQGAVGENTNLPLYNQTIEYNNEIITYNVDLSGLEGGLYRQLGVYFTCPTCLSAQPNFPYCKSLWVYADVINLIGTDVSTACDSAVGSNPGTSIFTNIANPFEVDSNNFPVNAEYWNDVNMWRTNVFQGGVLLESENEEETYLITMGHPVTTRPCDYDRQFCFYDRFTNRTECRYFICPCKEWGLPLSGIYPPGLGCGNCCDGEYSWFTSGTQYPPNYDPTRDFTPRLYVMRKITSDGTTQQPLPNTIKRYKPLIGKVRLENWPVFGVDSQFRFWNGITTLRDGGGNSRLTRDRQRNFMFGPNSFKGDILPLNGLSISIGAGEGDDGPYPAFSISSTGETIFVGFGSTNNSHYDYISDSDYLLYNLPITDERAGNMPCVEGNVFYKDEETKTIKLNTYCMPAFFHPELVIPNYPENDIKIYHEGNTTGNTITSALLTKWNSLLEQLGKPKILYYQFPEFVLPNDLYLPDNITELDVKYPLKQSPYLSRESKNNFFLNTNLIDFQEKRMLQASELNELQEKFHKKQSLLIEYINKKMTKQALEENSNKDILGFSKYDESGKNIFSTGKKWHSSKAIVFDNNMFTLGSATNPQNETNNVAELSINPGTIMLNSAFYKADNIIESASTFDLSFLINDIDFLKIETKILASVDFSRIQNNEINILTLQMDMSNLISCNEYNELRDNSSNDTNQFAPCGANRNYISIANNNVSIIQQNITSFIANNIERKISLDMEYLTPFNSVAYPGIYRFVLAFIENKDGVINFYDANGNKIQNI